MGTPPLSPQKLARETRHENRRRERDHPRRWADAIKRFLVWLAEQDKSAKTIRCYREELAAFGAWFLTELGEAPELGVSLRPIPGNGKHRWSRPSSPPPP